MGDKRKKGPKMKLYNVYLFRAPDCIRGWLAYVHPEHAKSATLTVRLYAENGAKAKNKAITMANQNFEGLEIVGKNFNDRTFGINNFADLKDRLSEHSETIVSLNNNESK